MLAEQGHKVYATMRDLNKRSALENEAEKRNAKLHVRQLDVQNEKSIQACVAEIIAQEHKIDVLINNAGAGFIKPMEQASMDEIQQVMDVNFYGVIRCCKAVMPYMRQQKSGHIINVSSLAGQNAHPKMSAYNASKFGLNGFTEAMMQELREDNIKVSLICPGSVNTEFGNKEITEEKAWQIQPEDIAEVVLELLKQKSNALSSKVEIRPSKPPKK